MLKILQKTTRFIAVGLAVFALSACATGPKIHSVSEQGVNFNAYQTFAFVDKLAPKDEQAYRSLTNKHLEEAIRTELSKRGLTEAKNADLLVNFHVSTKEKVTSTVSPALNGGYYGYRFGFGYGGGIGFGSETRVSQYTQGTLNIDVVDAARKQLIWEGVAVGKLKTPEVNRSRDEIFDVVAQIFAKYPAGIR